MVSFDEGFLEPKCGLSIFAFVTITQSDIPVGTNIPFLCCLPVPIESFLWIFLDPFTFVVTKAERVERINMSTCGGFHQETKAKLGVARIKRLICEDE